MENCSNCYHVLMSDLNKDINSILCDMTLVAIEKDRLAFECPRCGKIFYKTTEDLKLQMGVDE